MNSHTEANPLEDGNTRGLTEMTLCFQFVFHASNLMPLVPASREQAGDFQKEPLSQAMP